MMNTQTESVTKLYCFSLHEQYMNYVGYLTKQFARLEYAFHVVYRMHFDITNDNARSVAQCNNQTFIYRWFQCQNLMLNACFRNHIQNNLLRG